MHSGTGSTGNWLSLGVPRLFSLDLLSDDLIKVLAWLSNWYCQHEDIGHDRIFRQGGQESTMIVDWLMLIAGHI